MTHPFDKMRFAANRALGSESYKDNPRVQEAYRDAAKALDFVVTMRERAAAEQTIRVANAQIVQAKRLLDLFPELEN